MELMMLVRDDSMSLKLRDSLDSSYKDVRPVDELGRVHGQMVRRSYGALEAALAQLCQRSKKLATNTTRWEVSEAMGWNNRQR